MIAPLSPGTTMVSNGSAHNTRVKDFKIQEAISNPRSFEGEGFASIPSKIWGEECQGVGGTLPPPPLHWLFRRLCTQCQRVKVQSWHQMMMSAPAAKNFRQIQSFPNKEIRIINFINSWLTQHEFNKSKILRFLFHEKNRA